MRTRQLLPLIVLCAVLVAPASAAAATGFRVPKVGETGKSRGITGFRATFSAAPRRAGAADVGNYGMEGVTAKGARVPIQLDRVTFEGAKRRVRVATTAPFAQTRFARIVIRVAGGTDGVLGPGGARLDGGSATFRFRVVSGRSIAITDRDGDRATITIARGGRLDGIEPVGGPPTQRTQFWILDPIALRSTLSGSVQPKADGIVVIAEIIGLDKQEFGPSQ